MSRGVITVATTPHFARGQKRLAREFLCRREQYVAWQELPPGCPSHDAVPYAFKAFALEHERNEGDFTTLLWCDSCILPIRDLEPVWEHIEKHGALIMRGGFANAEWTAFKTYPELFPEFDWDGPEGKLDALRRAMQVNRQIPHVVAGFFGLDLRHSIGRAILAEYYRLASETRAFCGPREGPVGIAHRHDQTALSVIAWRLGVELVDQPQFFCYAKDGSTNPADYEERTVVIAHGGY